LQAQGFGQVIVLPRIADEDLPSRIDHAGCLSHCGPSIAKVGFTP
jgi:hypothetical protein